MVKQGREGAGTVHHATELAPKPTDMKNWDTEGKRKAWRWRDQLERSEQRDKQGDFPGQWLRIRL